MRQDKSARQTKVGRSKKASKNVSKKAPRGRTLSTLDKYLAGWNESKEDKKRAIVVVDSEDNGELAVVRLSSEPRNKRGTKFKNKTLLEEYSKRNKNKKVDTYFKHFLETEDNEKKPIKVNDKFKMNHKNMDVSQFEVDKIRTTIFSKARAKQRNKKIHDDFKKK